MKKFLLILSVLIMVVSVVSCKKDKSVEEKKDTDYTIITMEDLEKINGDNLEIKYNSNGRIDSIDGEFAYFPITDKDKAYEAFMGIVDFMHINPEDFVYDETASHENPNGLNVYYFQQYYKGIKIYGAYIQITVNPKHTERTYLQSTYIPNLDIDTEPKISSEEAVKLAEEKYDTEVYSESELVIFEGNLAWDMDLSDSETSRIIMQADNGTILYEEEMIID